MKIAIARFTLYRHGDSVFVLLLVLIALIGVGGLGEGSVEVLGIIISSFNDLQSFIFRISHLTIAHRSIAIIYLFLVDQSVSISDYFSILFDRL